MAVISWIASLNHKASEFNKFLDRKCFFTNIVNIRKLRQRVHKSPKLYLSEAWFRFFDIGNFVNSVNSVTL